MIEWQCNHRWLLDAYYPHTCLEEFTFDFIDATTEWAISRGIETATFHLLTPYPGTELYQKYSASDRILHRDWDLHDTRHAVFSHPNMSKDTLEKGYARSYETFYRWTNIIRSARAKSTWIGNLRHITYVGAWKKFDPLWSVVIRMRGLALAIPALERVLNGTCRTLRRDRRITRPNISQPTHILKEMDASQSPNR